MFSSRYLWCTPEAFVELTPRVFHHLLEQIDRAAAIEYYNGLARIWQAPRMKELPSLETYLGLVSNKPADEVKSDFDPEIDKVLEAHALKLLHERRGTNE